MLVLKWVERGLLAIGLALAVWAAVVVLEQWYYDRMPPPAVPVARYLPGEDPNEMVGTAGTIPRRVAPGTWVARLEAPSVDLAATVLEGADDRTLRRGAGHIEYTPMPGEPGNIGIAGHRDTTFRPIRNLRSGDLLTLITTDRMFDYMVTETLVVDPEDVDVLDPTDRPALTLVTCYPFNFIGHAPKRFIVRAKLVETRGR